MLYFAKPIFLYLLLLVPLIPAGFGLLRYFRRKRIRKFGDETLVRELMPSWSGTKGWVRIVLFALAFAIIIFSLSVWKYLWVLRLMILT